LIDCGQLLLKITVDNHKSIITAVAVTPGAIIEDHLLEKLSDKQPVKLDDVYADYQPEATESGV